MTSGKITLKSTPISEPPVKVKPFVDIEVLAALEAEMQEDAFVYVHCYIDNQDKDMLIRIWPTTYLVDSHSGTKSKLIHAENVSFAPMWTMVPDSVNYNFLLVFASLSKSCTHFDLREEVPTSGGFHVTNIQRNLQDVYHIDVR